MRDNMTGFKKKKYHKKNENRKRKDASDTVQARRSQALLNVKRLLNVQKSIGSKISNVAV